MAPPPPPSEFPVENLRFPILMAALGGDLPELKRLVDEGKKLGKNIEDFADFAAETALHVAAKNGHLEVFRYLLEELNVDVDIKDKYRRTPLHHACMCESETVHIARYLLHCKADPNLKSVFLRSPLHYAVEKGPKDLVELLLDNGAEVNAMASSGTPLQRAISKGRDDIVQFLLDKSADPNAISPLLFCPLLDSIIARDLQCMNLLLKAGADPNLGTSKGLSPLGYAAHEGWAAGIEFLLEEGANPNVTNNSGMTPLETAALKGCLDGVKMLFPLTVPIPSIQDWSIDGVIRHVASIEAEEERQRKLEERFSLSKSKGGEAYNRGDYHGAIEFYTEALYCKTDAVIPSNLSACWAQLKEGGRALEEAQMCISMRPDWAKAHYRKSVALMLLKDYDESYRTLYKAHRMDPEDMDIARVYEKVAALFRRTEGS